MDISEISRQWLEQQKAQHDPIELRQEIERKLKALYELRVRLSDEDDEEQAKAEPPLQAKRRVRQAEVGVGAPQLGTLRTGRSVAYGSLDSRSSKSTCQREKPE